MRKSHIRFAKFNVVCGPLCTLCFHKHPHLSANSNRKLENGDSVNLHSSHATLSSFVPATNSIFVSVVYLKEVTPIANLWSTHIHPLCHCNLIAHTNTTQVRTIFGERWCRMKRERRTQFHIESIMVCVDSASSSSIANNEAKKIQCWRSKLKRDHKGDSYRQVREREMASTYKSLDMWESARELKWFPLLSIENYLTFTIKPHCVAWVSIYIFQCQMRAKHFHFLLFWNAD